MLAACCGQRRTQCNSHLPCFALFEFLMHLKLPFYVCAHLYNQAAEEKAAAEKVAAEKAAAEKKVSIRDDEQRALRFSKRL